MGVRFDGRFTVSREKFFLVFLTNVSLFSFEQRLKCIPSLLSLQSSQRHSRLRPLAVPTVPPSFIAILGELIIK
jgi:hypothetical protein